MLQIQLKLSIPDFEHLHELVDKTVSRTIFIKIPRLSFNELLGDNFLLYDNLTSNCYTRKSPAKGLLYPDGTPKVIHDVLTTQKRKNSKLITIDKRYVLHMLIDHSMMIGKLQDDGYEIS